MEHFAIAARPAKSEPPPSFSAFVFRLLGYLFLVSLVFWRTGRGLGNLAGTIAASLGALPVLWPTVQTFNFDPFWSAAYRAQNVLPTPKSLLDCITAGEKPRGSRLRITSDQRFAADVR